MQAKSPVHELVKESLVPRLHDGLPSDVWIGVERTIYLSDKTALDPDISLFEAKDKARRIDGPRLLLAIEVAQSSLAYDRGLKARLYARHGVAEYWVVDVKRRSTTVHTGPREDGSWTQVRTVGPDEALTHPSVPAFALRLADV
jgi:Uma2 family endonuclease